MGPDTVHGAQPLGAKSRQRPGMNRELGDNRKSPGTDGKKKKEGKKPKGARIGNDCSTQLFPEHSVWKSKPQPDFRPSRLTRSRRIFASNLQATYCLVPAIAHQDLRRYGCNPDPGTPTIAWEKKQMRIWRNHLCSNILMKCWHFQPHSTRPRESDTIIIPFHTCLFTSFPMDTSSFSDSTL